MQGWGGGGSGRVVLIDNGRFINLRQPMLLFKLKPPNLVQM